MKILIAGGGTGGHLYPALAIAKSILKISPLAEIHFVGTSEGLETKIVPKENFHLHFISIGKLNSNVPLAERLRTVANIPRAFFQSLWLILKFKPDVILGVGGYASGPVVFVGALLGKRTIIWEPNAYPGLANRWLSRFVDMCCVVWEESSQYLNAKKIVRVPMPVRKEIEEIKPRVPSTANFRIFVFGGSQGSRVLNNTLIEMVKKGGPWLKTTEIVHQTGKLDFVRIHDEYANVSGAMVECREYIDDMPERYRWADLVITRSGTGTLSEIAACSKASILVPLPTSADDHQRKNAEVLVNKKAAVMILQNDLSADKLLKEIERLRSNPREIHELEQNVHQFHSSQAAEKIAELIIGEK